MTWLAETTPVEIPADYGRFGVVQPFPHLISSTRLVVVFRAVLGATWFLLALGGDVDPDTGAVSMDDPVTQTITLATIDSSEEILRVWALPDGGYYVETNAGSSG